jgi:RNA recognition motif-containing protein
MFACMYRSKDQLISVPLPPPLQILHVSGLMESVTREQLRELFSQAGEVTKVDIPDGGRSMVRPGWW